PQAQVLTERVLPEVRARVLIVLNSSDLARIAPCTQEMEEFEYIINVDHHHHNSQFGHLNMVDPGASSTTEMLFYLFWEKVEIDYDMVLCLYTGLVFDTGRFQYANTTQRSHHMASHLIGLGVNPNYVFRNVYENQPPGVLDLYARALQRAHFHRDTGLIHSYVKLQDLQDHALSFSASERVIDFLRSVRGVTVAAVFKEYEKGYRVSLRSTGDQDVSKIALSFGGGGHPMAAGFEWHGEMAACLMRLQQEIKRQLKSKRDESQ
ncbi:DHH family phosphoesterase, partial [Candidatus Hakubella thermalkaliphila]